MAEPDRTNADAERVSDVVARLRDPSDGWSGDAFAVSAFVAAKAADIIEAQSKALAEAREALKPFAEAAMQAVADANAGRSSDKYKTALMRAWAANDIEWADFERVLALTPTPENSNG